MRQVPHYLIIGSGRMATHIQHYFTLLKLPFDTWARKYNSHDELPTLIPQCTHTLLLISDSQIKQFCETHFLHHKKILVHFSGQLSLDNIYSAHPLMSFSPELYELQTYQTIPFVLEENSPSLETLLPGLPNAGVKIPSHLKSYYHALCVMSGNFTTILWQKFFDEWMGIFGLPKELLFPYLNQITRNLICDSNAALTGPLIRKDYSTITNHKIALKEDEFREIYNAFVTTFEKRGEK